MDSTNEQRWKYLFPVPMTHQDSHSQRTVLPNRWREICKPTWPRRIPRFQTLHSSWPSKSPELFCRDRSDPARYRSACENVILQDFNFAASKEVEHKLWGIHGRINNRFRKELKHVRQVFFIFSQLQFELIFTVSRRRRQKKAGRAAQEY